MALLAVIGYPISHSASPVMYNALFRARNLPHRYMAIETPPEHLEETLEILHRIGYIGLNITIPHKETAAKIAASLSEEATAVGAVNTLVRCEQGWIGYNTDATGVVGCLSPYIPNGCGAALVLGAGGSAAAAVYALGRLGVTRAFIANRTKERAERLATRARGVFGIECETIGIDEAGEAAKSAEVIINATPLGLTYHEPMLGPRDLTPRHVVLDMVYSPQPTPLQRVAEASGSVYIDGVRMLVEQGAGSARIFLSIEPDKEVMEGAVRAWLSERRARRP